MIAELIQYILRLLGFGQTSEQRQEAQKAKLKKDRKESLLAQSAQFDRLEEIMEEIQKDQVVISETEKKRDAATGLARTTLDQKIAILFSILNTKVGGPLVAVLNNLKTSSVISVKIDEAIEILSSPINPDSISNLIKLLEELHDAQSDVASLTDELVATRTTSSISTVHNEENLATLHKENPNLASDTVQNTQSPKKTEVVSPATAEPLTE